jgi:hypothetical protein
MKLDGYNPAVIISQEIRESTHAGKDYEKSLHAIIRGDPKFNILLTHSLPLAQHYYKKKKRKGKGKGGEHSSFDGSVDIRANVKEKCSSAKEQVECLVDMATDPNILGRTWGGWAPWI